MHADLTKRSSSTTLFARAELFASSIAAVISPCEWQGAEPTSGQGVVLDLYKPKPNPECDTKQYSNIETLIDLNLDIIRARTCEMVPESDG
jgi:hypothetical protein